MSDEITVLRLGLYLEANKGYVLDFKPSVHEGASVVLCFLSHNTVHPFVVHTYNDLDGKCYSGDYCLDITRGVDTFRESIA